MTPNDAAAATGGPRAPGFGLSVDPSRIVAHRAWVPARAGALEALRDGRVVAVLGPAGTGKTLLLRDLAEALASEGVRVVVAWRGDVVLDPDVDAVLLVDEAGRADAATWAALTRPGRFGRLLADLPPLAARLPPETPVVELEALRPEEIGSYVAERLRREGLPPDSFGDDALARLAARSGGVPRRINLLAGTALFLSSLDARSRVERADIDAAAAMHGEAAVATEPDDDASAPPDPGPHDPDRLAATRGDVDPEALELLLRDEELRAALDLSGPPDHAPPHLAEPPADPTEPIDPIDLVFGRRDEDEPGSREQFDGPDRATSPRSAVRFPDELAALREGSDDDNEALAQAADWRTAAETKPVAPVATAAPSVRMERIARPSARQRRTRGRRTRPLVAAVLGLACFAAAAALWKGNQTRAPVVRAIDVASAPPSAPPSAPSSSAPPSPSSPAPVSTAVPDRTPSPAAAPSPSTARSQEANATSSPPASSPVLPPAALPVQSSGPAERTSPAVASPTGSQFPRPTPNPPMPPGVHQAAPSASPPANGAAQPSSPPPGSPASPLPGQSGAASVDPAQSNAAPPIRPVPADPAPTRNAPAASAPPAVHPSEGSITAVPVVPAPDASPSPPPAQVAVAQPAALPSLATVPVPVGPGRGEIRLPEGARLRVLVDVARDPSSAASSATAVSDALRRLGLVVDTGAGGPSRPGAPSEVRYFFAEDRDSAELVARVASETLKENGLDEPVLANATGRHAPGDVELHVGR